MHLESIEPRRLFAASGLDKSIGDGDGKVELPGRYAVLSLTGVGHAVYAVVADRPTRTQYLYKYDDAGHVDTSFGDRGRQALAFRTSTSVVDNAAQIVVDRRTGAVYVGNAGSKKTDTSARATLEIERFTSAGAVDTGFGQDGVYAYTTQLRRAPDSEVNFTLDRLVPIGHGKLLVALDTRQSTNNGDGTHYEETGAAEIQLQRLRADGRRDPTFNRRGIAVVRAGTFTEAFSDGGSHEDSTAPVFGDLQVRYDGSVRVIDTRETSSRTSTDGATATFSTIQATRYVDSAVLNADGSAYVPDGPDDVDAPFTVTLSRVSVKNAKDYVEFAPVQATIWSADEVIVLGRSDNDLLRIAVGPTGRGAPTELDVPGTLPYGPTKALLAHDTASGRTYVASSAGTTAFDSYLEPARGWGKNGTVPGVYTAYFPDDQQRLLFADDGGFGRLSGT